MDVDKNEDVDKHVNKELEIGGSRAVEQIRELGGRQDGEPEHLTTV